MFWFVIHLFTIWQIPENNAEEKINFVLNARWIEAFAIIINLGVIFSIFLLIYFKIIKPLRQAARIAQSVISVEEVRKHSVGLNEISYLKSAVEILLEKEIENKWQNEVFMQLSTILNESYVEQHKLGENIVFFLMKYAQANAGSLYLVSESKSEFIR